MSSCSDNYGNIECVAILFRIRFLRWKLESKVAHYAAAFPLLSRLLISLAGYDIGRNATKTIILLILPSSYYDDVVRIYRYLIDSFPTAASWPFRA